MSIKVMADNKEVLVEVIKFSDGGSNIKMHLPEIIEKYISVTIENEPVDTYPYLIMLTNNILDEFYQEDDNNRTDLSEIEVILNLPYYPHARADRAFDKGMATPKNIVDFIIDFSWFDKVITEDLHSYNSYSKNTVLEIVHQSDIFLQYGQTLRKHYPESVFNDYYSLVSPDKGAKEKVVDLSKKLIPDNKFQSVIYCNKERDVKTGIITNTSVEGDVKGKNLIIVDDICDGGGTFLLLAEKLKELGANKIMLYVTHGIFSKGLNKFKGLIDEIRVHNIVGDYITVRDINNFNFPNYLEYVNKKEKNNEAESINTN